MFVIFGEALKNQKLMVPNRDSIQQYIRYVLALNLTAIDVLLRRSWGFSSIVDGATRNSRGYLDVRLAFVVLGKLYNFHFLAIPTGGLAQTGENYAELVLEKLKSVAGPEVLLKLIGTATDGAANMLGCRRGFVSRVRTACGAIGGCAIVANWCGSHQLNLVIGDFLSVLDGFIDFRSVLGTEISFTHTHTIVQQRIGRSCPTYATTRWDSIHDSCKFLSTYYLELIQLQKEKGRDVSSPSWWLCLFFVADFTQALKICFAKLQYKHVTIVEQYQALQKLLATIQFRFEENSEGGTPVISELKLEREIFAASAFSRNCYCSLSTQEQQQLILAVSDALETFVAGVVSISLSIDKEPRYYSVTTPQLVVNTSDDCFGDLIERHSERLSYQFTGTAISKVWSQRKMMRKECHAQRSFKRLIDQVSTKPTNKEWSDPDFDRRFGAIKSFALGLASITHGSHSIEGDFSNLKCLKSKLRNRLTDFPWKVSFMQVSMLILCR